MSHIETNSGGWRITRDGERVLVRQGMLDKLLRGGLALPPPDRSKDGLIVMLRGAAGTGKSTLALQLAANMEPPRGVNGSQPVLRREFFSLEQDAAELKAIYCRMIVHQCRADRGLLAANSAATPVPPGGENGRDAAIDQVLGLLGRTGAGPEVRERADRVLQRNDEPIKENAVELIRDIDPARIRFNNETPATRQLKDDPLSRAYTFVETFAPNGDRKRRPVIVIDGLSILSEEDRVRLEMGALIESLRKRALIGIIAYEPSADIEESLDHQVDVVIELEEKHLSAPIDYIVHELHFKKTRYQEAALGWHQYKIRGYGLEIFPSVHFQVHSHGYMPKQLMDSLKPLNEKNTEDQPREDETNQEEAAKEKAAKAKANATRWSAIERILNGIKDGDSVALLGPRGAFKTTLTLDFLLRSHLSPCQPGKKIGSLDEPEHGLLVSVIDNEDTLRTREQCPLLGKSGGCLSECCKHVFLFYQRPGCISASEFLHYLKTRLQMAAQPIKRLAFWDLTQLEHRFPLLANDPMFVPALLDLFKMRSSSGYAGSMVKSVFMGAANAQLSNAIAAVADNVIFCWRDRVKQPPDKKPGDEPQDLADALDRIWKRFPQEEIIGDTTIDRTDADYLMLYVDRTSGGFGKERKNLYAFPISQRAQLLLPAGEWSADEYLIKPDLIPLFDQSEDKILHVTEMQGFGADLTAQNQTA